MDYGLRDLMMPAGAAEEEKVSVRNVVVSLDLAEMSGCSVKERKRRRVKESDVLMVVVRTKEREERRLWW